MPRSNRARVPQLLSLRVWSLCSATGEAATVRGPCTAMKSGPRSPQLEKALAQKRRPRGFHRGAVVENLSANAGHKGSSPGLGRSHMPRSNYAREPQLLSLRVWSLCSATREAAIMKGPRTDEEWPPLATTRESPRTETKTQESQK